MYTIHFCASNESNHGLYNYQTTGSLDQIIENARVKSLQIPMLKDKQWLVLIKQDHKTIANRAIFRGKII